MVFQDASRDRYRSRKILLFRSFQITQRTIPGKASHRKLRRLFLKAFRFQSLRVWAGFPLDLLLLLNIRAPLSHNPAAKGHASRRWPMLSSWFAHKTHLDVRRISLRLRFSPVIILPRTTSQQKMATFRHGLDDQTFAQILSSYACPLILML